MASITAAVFGSTGHSGQHILAALLAADSTKSVHTFSRRMPKAESPKLAAHVERDTAKWAPGLLAAQPPPGVVISSLAMTIAEAGNAEDKRKIDHDLNIELAQAAKSAGAKTYVFVSSVGAGGFFSPYFPYIQMKTGVENAIAALDFETAIVLRPGVILGQRETPVAFGPFSNSIVRGLGCVSKGIQDSLGQEGEAIGRAAVRAAQIAAEGKAPSRFWVIAGSDIVKLADGEMRGGEEHATG